MGNAASIWPTSKPDPLVSEGRKQILLAAKRSGLSWNEAEAEMWLAFNKAKRAQGEALHRARAIGEGLVRARQRMGRFLRWCRKNRACAGGLRLARRSRSPEHAMEQAAASTNYETRISVSWVAWNGVGRDSEWRMRLDDARWSYDHTLLQRVTRDFLASPEWTSLPWQRDPGVGHG